MGKALYREYRPKSLEGVVGQKHITDTLKNALKKGSISHAYFFTGPRGVGKTSIARILAHEINNIPYTDESPHLDIIEIDAASNRRIDEIRDLRDKVYITPTTAKYKVYIIDEVHMLTREAFNALLKTLEEPPEHVVFILATTEAHKVPETIQSRTQRYSFKPITVEDTVAHLKHIASKENLEVNNEALRLLAEHGRGSFRDSISMLDQIAGFGHQRITEKEIGILLGVPQSSLVDELLDATASSNSGKLFEIMQALREQGVDPSTLSQVIIGHLRDKLIKNETDNNSFVIPLMKNLLPLTSGNASFEAVEISLLDVLPTSTDLSKNRPSETQKNDVKISIQDKNLEQRETQRKVLPPNDTVITKQNEKAEKLPSTAKLSNENSDKSWLAVLGAIKGKHNTVYGLLRMATAEITDSTIVLTFGFEFHKKQLEQSRNFTNLQKIIKKTLDKPYKLELKVVKNQINKPEYKKESQNDALRSVSNIFDGAELLES